MKNQPTMIVHADWGTSKNKRWMCVARQEGGGYRVENPEPVDRSCTLLHRLRSEADGRGLLVGFDFPIGLPEAYCKEANIGSFREILMQLGLGPWKEFFNVAREAEEISLGRPFYPYKPGGTKQVHLLNGLGLESMKELLRDCEKATRDRKNTAESLFWTLGPKQVGKAAISGWSEVIQPMLLADDANLGLWPFDGDLETLLSEKEIVVAETYPAEACLHLGLSPPGNGWRKRCQEDRQEKAKIIFSHLEQRDIELKTDLQLQALSGFGSQADGEDRFDAFVGLLSMLEVVLGHRKEGAPEEAKVRKLEGWILGQVRDEVQALKS